MLDIFSKIQKFIDKSLTSKLKNFKLPLASM